MRRFVCLRRSVLARAARRVSCARMARRARAVSLLGVELSSGTSGAAVRTQGPEILYMIDKNVTDHTTQTKLKRLSTESVP